ncbi:MAG TPA: ABC transporter ATP-binding protein [Anaerolineae bacterium]|nr:ABC transporter ATP-binding protein [Anaerolineae bacterium]
MADYEDIELEEEEFQGQMTGRTLRRILGLTRPHWRWVVGFLLLIALVSTLDALFTFLSKQMVDQGIVPGDRARLLELVRIYCALIFVQAGAVFGFIYLAGILGERIQYDLRKRMFDHLQALSFAYYSRTPIGWLMSRVTSDSERVAQLVTWGILDITWAIMNITTSLVFMMLINWQLALIVMGVIPVLFLVALYFQRRILTQYRNVRRVNSRITAAYNETITGVKVIKALNREEENLAEFDRLTSDMYRAGYRAAVLSAMFLPAVQLVASFAVAAVVWYAGLEALNPNGALAGLTIGGIAAFVSYITFMIWPIQDLARVFAELQNALASAERIFSLEDTPPDIVDQPGAIDPGTVRGDIEFEHVSFFYEPGKLVLDDFSLTIRQGETIALVGPTGGGKSTIVNLLCRFYEPRMGVVRVNGRDYRELTQHALQSRLGIVLQTPYLFSGPIRENIRYGRLDASDEEVEAAARMAGAHAFIATLPKGYEQEVGEGGTLLSVGQKQLLSLARAVLARPEIFIMDEATSSVDTLTEALIQQGMETLMAGRTSVVIAHRLSTIRRADRILVIEGGRIAEIGSHSELLRARGHYYNLYTQQFRQETTVEEVAREMAFA